MTSQKITTSQKISHGAPLTHEQFAHLGEGALAYVKQMRSDEVQSLYPGLPPMAPGMPLFVLLNATGAPIMITDTRDEALANAWEQELLTVSLH
jgi:hypothetical protein